jgi:hypothetical protein
VFHLLNSGNIAFLSPETSVVYNYSCIGTNSTLKLIYLNFKFWNSLKKISHGNGTNIELPEKCRLLNLFRHPAAKTIGKGWYFQK